MFRLQVYKSKLSFLLLLLPILSGCATLYGYNIHAPGLLSEEFSSEMATSNARVALYIPEGLKDYMSDDKGNWHSDPQNYFIGESFVPMMVEAFNHSFEEFILIEDVPTPAIMQRYGIPYLAVVEITGFRNRKNLQGQGLDLFTETTLFKQDLSLLARFETQGTSQARAVFAKKGGPEVNLNAAIESNLRSVVDFVQGQIQVTT